MTFDEAKACLESLEGVFVRGTWYYCGTFMSCGDGCCEDSFESVDEALDSIEFYCGGDWSMVTRG